MIGDDQHGAVWSLDSSLVRVVVLVVDGQELVNGGSAAPERVIGNEEKVIYKRVLKKAKSKRKWSSGQWVSSSGQVVWLVTWYEWASSIWRPRSTNPCSCHWRRWPHCSAKRFWGWTGHRRAAQVCCWQTGTACKSSSPSFPDRQECPDWELDTECPSIHVWSVARELWCACGLAAQSSPRSAWCPCKRRPSCESRLCRVW